MPKFSIVIPCYNTARHVGAAIRSVLAKTASDLEVIVVDDGSTDDSAAAIAAEAVDPRVRVIRQANQGLGGARNAGLAAAKGEYINFLDADDLLEPDKLAKQGRVLDENPGVGLVLCNGVFIDAEGNRKPGDLVQLRRLAGSMPLFEVLFSGGQFPPHVPLLRRRLALQAGGMAIDREMAGWADTGFWLRVALECPAYHVVAEPLCCYRAIPGSMSADEAGMERAALLTYASLMRDRPADCAGALRFLHRRLIDLEMANLQLRGTLDFANQQIERLKVELVAGPVKARASELESRLRMIVDGLCSGASRRPLVIWGAGSGGRRVERLVTAVGGNVAAFVDSDPAKAGATIAGIPVVSPSGIPRDAFVLIASVHAPAIEPRLGQAGMARHRDFIPIDFETVQAMESRGPTVCVPAFPLPEEPTSCTAERQASR